MKRIFGGWRWALTSATAAAAIGVGSLCVAPALGGDKGLGSPPLGTTQEPQAALDQLILKSGKVVEGRILEETDAMVKIRVRVAGIEAVTSYPRAEILEVKRAAAAPAAPANTGSPAAGGTATAPEAPKDGPSEDKPAEDASVDPSAARVYLVELEGRFGFDVSETPLRRIFEDADKTFGDTIAGHGTMKGKTVVDPTKRDQNIIVLKMDCFSQPEFGSIFRAEELAPIVKEQIVDRGRRVVFWIERAAGGAAFLPWVSPEMYFTSDGVLGGIAELDKFSSGDHMVDEKLISAFLGHAEGFAIKGGYGDHIPALRAMLRAQNWLYVRLEGGRPVYLTRKPNAEDGGEGWIELSDDGKGENQDKSAVKGNDTFSLEAQWAEKLGISDGTADTVDDLAFRLGIQRNYVELKDARGQKIYDDWKERLEQAARQINPEERPGLPLGRLWREYRDIGDGGGTPEDRKRDRGRKINLLKQIRGIVSQYAEVLDSEGRFRAQIDTMLAELAQQAEMESRNNRSGGPGGGSGGGGGGGLR